MATPVSAIPAPPTQQPAPQGTPPTSPPVASAAPPKPNPQLQQDTEQILNVVRTLRGIAQSYPAAAPFVSKMTEEIRQIMKVIMEHQEAGETAAPPVAG
jgi:hypothetical protein